MGLTNGRRQFLQRENLQDLESATKEQLANVQVEMCGTSLSWPDLDVDLYVPSLLKGIYGTKRWMSELGRLGGSVNSTSKTTAAKLNGRKGGRPRKRKTRKPALVSGE